MAGCHCRHPVVVSSKTPVTDRIDKGSSFLLSSTSKSSTPLNSSHSSALTRLYVRHDLDSSLVQLAHQSFKVGITLLVHRKDVALAVDR